MYKFDFFEYFHQKKKIFKSRNQAPNFGVAIFNMKSCQNCVRCMWLMKIDRINKKEMSSKI